MRCTFLVLLLLFPLLGLVAQDASVSNSLKIGDKKASNPLSIRLFTIESYSTPISINTNLLDNSEKPIPLSSKVVIENDDTASNREFDNENKSNNQSELDQTGTARYYALVIGVSDYKYSSERLNDLENPIKDAKTLAKTLQRYDFATSNICLLENPNRDKIIDVLDSLAKVISVKDNLLIFYAGHGYWDENLSVGYWLPADAQIDKKSTWISNSNLKDYVSGIKAKHTLLISDACFSGSIFKARAVADPLSDYGVAKLYRLPSRKAMTSGNMNTTPDKSKFFEYLNKRLLENDQKFLSSRELFYSLYNAVINNTNTVPQYGVIQDTGDEGGDFIFIKK